MENMYKIVRLSFMGSKGIFESRNEKDTSLKLIEIKAYKQPTMMDAGCKLYQDDREVHINAFVEDNLSEQEIQEQLDK